MAKVKRGPNKGRGAASQKKGLGGHAAPATSAPLGKVNNQEAGLAPRSTPLPAAVAWLVGHVDGTLWPCPPLVLPTAAHHCNTPAAACLLSCSAPNLRWTPPLICKATS